VTRVALVAAFIFAPAAAAALILLAAPTSGAPAGPFADSGPTWSPDGTRIAFWRYGYTGAEGESGVYVASAGGGEPRKIVPASAREPAWAPDGKTLAYSTETSIRRVNADGSQRRTLSGRLKGTVWHPVWSRDGMHIAFLRTIFRGGGSEGEIWVVRPDGTRLRRVAVDVPFRPGLDPTPFSWAPDGRRLVYVRLANRTTDLWIVRVDGGKPRRVLRTSVSDRAPMWSPDGSRIAFTGKEVIRPTRIFVLDLARRTVEKVAFGLRPRWAPSGERLAFIGTSNGIGLYVAELGSGDATKLLASERGVGEAEWAPQGDRLAVAAYGVCSTRLTGIYIVGATGGAARITNPC
jgi:dipeptidyl aminopeptidase/acylaminoacyl peptidase